MILTKLVVIVVITSFGKNGLKNSVAFVLQNSPSFLKGHQCGNEIPESGTS